MSSAYIAGVGMVPFELATKSKKDYPDMGFEASKVLFETK
jgi:hypothetical protein